MAELSDEQFRDLLTFRTALRRFHRWSQRQAAAAGLTPAQHQLLVAIRGHPDPRGPTIGDVAEYLLLRHHSTVELVDRAVAGGLLSRRRDPIDGRLVRLSLTETGSARLDQLAELHLAELARLAPSLGRLTRGIGPMT